MKETNQRKGNTERNKKNNKYGEVYIRYISTY